MNDRAAVLGVAVDGPLEGSIAAALADADVDFVRAESGTDALKRLEDSIPDCVVAPAVLPDLPPAGFVSTVREVAPDVPIVLVGGDPPDIDGVEHVPAGEGVEDDLRERAMAAVGRRRAERAVDRHERLKDVVWDAASAILDAPSRAAVENAVHDRFVASGLYRFVWLGEYDPEVDRLAINVPIDGVFDPDRIDAFGDGADDFVARAVADSTVVVAESDPPMRGVAAVSTDDGAGAPATPSTGLSSAAVPLAHDGRTVGVLILSTRRDRAFEAAERDLLAGLGRVIAHAIEVGEEGADAGIDGVESFADTVVHELRSPLGIARAHLEIARENDTDEALDRVENALTRMEHVLENVSAIAGLDGIEGTERRELDADARETWTEVSAPEATLEIEDSRAIVADHDLLQRLLSNLFRNAVEHASRDGADEHAGPDVTVRVGTTDEGFYVEDDGPGIPEEERERVFDRGYSTGDNPGLGLDIVRAVAEAHGWTVSVTEGTDGGARFEFAGIDRPPTATGVDGE